MPILPPLVITLVAGLACAAGQVQLGENPRDPAKERARAVERAKTLLCETLKVKESELALESAKEATWPDAALGCPEKDRMYAQVVTRGWKVILKVRAATHEVHVAGARAILCPPKPAAPKEPSR